MGFGHCINVDLDDQSYKLESSNVESRTCGSKTTRVDRRDPVGG